MPAGLLLRCALPMRPLPPPPRPGGGHRGATWPSRAEPCGDSRGRPWLAQPPAPIAPAPAEPSARSQAAVPEPMVRAERRGGACRDQPADRSTLPAPSLRRGCLGDTERLSGLRETPRCPNSPEQGESSAGISPRWSSPRCHRSGCTTLPSRGVLGMGRPLPSPARVRTGLARLEQSARGYGLGPAAAQSRGEHPHASLAWVATPGALPTATPGSGESHEHFAHTAGTFLPSPVHLSLSLLRGWQGKSPGNRWQKSLGNCCSKICPHHPAKPLHGPFPKATFPSWFLIRTLNAARAGRGQPGRQWWAIPAGNVYVP